MLRRHGCRLSLRISGATGFCLAAVIFCATATAQDISVDELRKNELAARAAAEAAEAAAVAKKQAMIEAEGRRPGGNASLPAAPSTEQPQPPEESQVASGEPMETIITIDGGSLTGRVSGLQGDILSLSGGVFAEPVGVRLSAVADIQSHSVESEPGKMTVVLNNGDRIVGELLMIDEESITFAGTTIEPMNIRRSMVMALRSEGSDAALIDCRMNQLQANGQWKNPDRQRLGQLSSYMTFGKVLQADVEQTGPITFVLNYRVKEPFGKAARGPGRRAAETAAPLGFCLALYCDVGDGRAQFAGASINGTSYRIFERGNQGNSSWGSSSSKIKPAIEGEVRLAYDNVNRTLNLWINGQHITERQLGSAFERGSSVFFSHDSNYVVTRARLLTGVVAPESEIGRASCRERV